MMVAGAGAPRHGRRSRLAHRALLCLTVVLAVAVVVTGAVYGYARYRLDQIHRVSLASAPAGSGPGATAPLVDEAPGQPFNLVLVGSDSRSFAAGQADRQKYGDTSIVDGQRSDTLMVVHVDPGARTAHVLSIHRDLYVPISGARGSAKINSALERGPAALLKTLRDDLGIAASHFVQVDFVSFQKVVDAIGPVPFYFPTPVRDAYTGLDVGQPGCASLNGTNALALVRSRHLEYLQDGRWRDDATDDRGRMVRQQDFLRRVLQLAVSHGLTNPATLNQLVGSIAPSLTVDSGFGTAEMGRLGRRFASSGPSGITWSVLPVLDAKIDGQDVERLDQPAADAMLTTFGGSARGSLASRSTTSTRFAGQAGPDGSVPLATDLTVRIVGSRSAPDVAELARQDLASAGVTATVALAGGPPSPRVRISSSRQAQAAAAMLAGSVPGATSTIDAALKGTGIVMAVGASWPGMTTRDLRLPDSTTTSAPSTSTSTTMATTTTTIAAKGTDERVNCP